MTEYLRVKRYDELLAAFAALSHVSLRECLELVAASTDVLDRLRENDRLHPPRFNIFLALGHEYREVGTHSAMLAFLLDPMADHAQGALFLDHFLETLEKAGREQGLEPNFPRPKKDTLWEWSCRKEFVLQPPKLGRADFVLRAPQLLIVIENKVHAKLGDDQLDRYWTYAQEQAGQVQDRKAYIVYLTPDGIRPAAGGIIPKTSFICLSYRDHIHDFLRQAIDNVRAGSVAEVLRQYASLVKELI
jgi:hypothetical protein